MLADTCGDDSRPVSAIVTETAPPATSPSLTPVRPTVRSRRNSGATLVYLSPGAYFHLTHTTHAFAFMQLPIYQRVNGLQLEPKYTASVGVRFMF